MSLTCCFSAAGLLFRNQGYNKVKLKRILQNVLGMPKKKIVFWYLTLSWNVLERNINWTSTAPSDKAECPSPAKFLDTCPRRARLASLHPQEPLASLRPPSTPRMASGGLPGRPSAESPWKRTSTRSLRRKRSPPQQRIKTDEKGR